MRGEIRESLTMLGTAALIMLAVVAAIGLCGCTRTVYEPVERVRTEYRDNVVERVVVDSVTDTRFVFIKGDTVIDYRDRIRWREREVHDTTLMVLTDSIPVPYPVERELTRWEQTKIDYGGAALGAWIAVMCIAVIWLIKKYRK